MGSAISLLAMAGALSVGGTAVQEKPSSTGVAGVLTAVHVTQSVLANGKPLPAGLYELRFTNERPTPLPGQSPDAERWVEFVANDVEWWRTAGVRMAATAREHGVRARLAYDGLRMNVVTARSSSSSR